MSGITTEGYTKNPVLPTCAVVDYTDASLPTATAAGSAWITSSSNWLTPAAALDQEHLNSFPVKITPNNASKYVSIQPGTYEFVIQYIARETGGATAEVGIALTDGTTNYFVNDLDGTSHLGANFTFVGSHSGTLAVSEPTDLSLAFVKRSSTGILTPYRIKLLLQRLCDYTED